MRKLFFIVILLGLATLGANAQKKSLKTETDGFQWYRVYSSDYKYTGAESANGEPLIPLSREFNMIAYQPSSERPAYFSVRKGAREGGKKGAYDIYGVEIVAPQYDKLHYDKSAGFYWIDSLNGRHFLGIMLGTDGRAFKVEVASNPSSDNDDGVAANTSATTTKTYNNSYSNTFTNTYIPPVQHKQKSTHSSGNKGNKHSTTQTKSTPKSSAGTSSSSKPSSSTHKPTPHKNNASSFQSGPVKCAHCSALLQLQR